MRGYLSVLRTRTIAGLQYRAAAWAGIATQFFWGFMLLMVFNAFYRNGGEQTLSFPQLAAYIWLQQAFMTALFFWNQDGELLSMIAGGNVAYELCRPYSLYSLWFMRMLARRVSQAALRFLPVLLVAFLLPEPYRLTPPPSAGAFLLFFLSLMLAVLLVTAISMFICILTFLTLSPSGPRMLFGMIAEFLAGSLLPLPLMPDGLRSALYFLPFAYTLDFPFRVYSGNIPVQGALAGIAVQLLWLLLLIPLGGAAMGRVLRRVVIQGG